eukprot:Gb_02477 [translate_table: standard]
MGEMSGLLKVRVVKGMRLAVRDLFPSSDPYVVLKFGTQMVKTRVIKRNLNPVWDQELTLNLTTPLCPLKVEVFDKDTFTADDKMGDAEIDLQHLASAVRMTKVLTRTSTAIQVRKVAASKTNYLAKDSCILFVDGTMIQEVCLRLHNVECGELELQLKWVDLPSGLEGK